MICIFVQTVQYQFTTVSIQVAFKMISSGKYTPPPPHYVLSELPDANGSYLLSGNMSENVKCYKITLNDLLLEKCFSA